MKNNNLTPRSATTDPQMRNLLQAAFDAGWKISKARKHIKLVAPDGQLVVCPSSPSDHRSHLNARSELRKRGLDV